MYFLVQYKYFLYKSLTYDVEDDKKVKMHDGTCCTREQKTFNFNMADEVQTIYFKQVG
jgi:hypothetical protein